MNIYLASSPLFSPTDVAYIGPFEDLAQANLAQQTRWPHAEVVVLAHQPRPDRLRSPAHAAPEHNARR